MRHVVKAILLVTVLFSLQACGTTVQPGQRGLRWYPLTEGLTIETLKSGFYWRAPWNRIYLYDVQWRSYTETVDALSSDDLVVALKTAIVMRPIPEEVYFLAQEIGSDFYPRIVKPELLAAVRSVVSNYPIGNRTREKFGDRQQGTGGGGGETQRPPSGSGEYCRG